MSTELVVVVGHSQTTILGEMQTRPGRHLSILQHLSVEDFERLLINAPVLERFNV
jgi:hypothetical protein